MAQYQSLEVAVSARRYFFLNNSSKVYAAVSYIKDVSLNSSVRFGNGPDFKLFSYPNFALGLGYKLKDKLGVELRYNTERDIESREIFYSSRYKSTALVIGFSLN